MTFDEWYKNTNPDLKPEDDEFYKELREAYKAGYIEGSDDGWEAGLKACGQDGLGIH